MRARPRARCARCTATRCDRPIGSHASPRCGSSASSAACSACGGVPPIAEAMPAAAIAAATPTSPWQPTCRRPRAAQQRADGARGREEVDLGVVGQVLALERVLEQRGDDARRAVRRRGHRQLARGVLLGRREREDAAALRRGRGPRVERIGERGAPCACARSAARLGAQAPALDRRAHRVGHREQALRAPRPGSASAPSFASATNADATSARGAARLEQRVGGGFVLVGHAQRPAADRGSPAPTISSSPTGHVDAIGDGGAVLVERGEAHCAAAERRARGRRGSRCRRRDRSARRGGRRGARCARVRRPLGAARRCRRRRSRRGRRPTARRPRRASAERFAPDAGGAAVELDAEARDRGSCPLGREVVDELARGEPRARRMHRRRPRSLPQDREQAQIGHALPLAARRSSAALAASPAKYRRGDRSAASRDRRPALPRPPNGAWAV